MSSLAAVTMTSKKKPSLDERWIIGGFSTMRGQSLMMPSSIQVNFILCRCRLGRRNNGPGAGRTSPVGCRSWERWRCVWEVSWRARSIDGGVVSRRLGPCHDREWKASRELDLLRANNNKSPATKCQSSSTRPRGWSEHTKHTAPPAGTGRITHPVDKHRPESPCVTKPLRHRTSLKH